MELKPFEIIQVWLGSGQGYGQHGFSQPYLLLVKDATAFNKHNTRAILVFDIQTLSEYKVFLRASSEALGIDTLFNLGRIQVLPGVRLLAEWTTSDNKQLAIIDLSKPLD